MHLKIFMYKVVVTLIVILQLLIQVMSCQKIHPPSTHSSAFNNLDKFSQIQQLGNTIPNMSTCKTLPDSLFVMYNNVTHDPLSREEERSCSDELVKEVHK